MIKTLLFVLYMCGIFIGIADLVRNHELFLKNGNWLANAGELLVLIVLVMCWPLTCIKFIIDWIGENF